MSCSVKASGHLSRFKEGEEVVPVDILEKNVPSCRAGAKALRQEPVQDV